MGEPNFVIAGGQRCGTTTLYKLLDQHPEIYLAKPLRPEPKFFLSEPRPPHDKAWYLHRWFADAPDVPAIGEKSTSYLETPGTAQRMRRLFPDMRPIFILRHPIERAISNYRFSRAHGLEPLSLDEAMTREPERLAERSFDELSAHPHAYLRRGRYADHLQSYVEAFGKDRMLVLLHDWLAQDAVDVCRRVFAFLGVDADFVPPQTDIRENVLSAEGLSISPATLDAIFEHFAKPNQRLARMFDLDLSAWSRITPAIEAIIDRSA